MDQKPKLMTPFDMLVTSSSLYTLKLMLPFAPASIQRSLAIYIKFSESEFIVCIISIIFMRSSICDICVCSSGLKQDFMKGVFNNE